MGRARTLAMLLLLGVAVASCGGGDSPQAPVDPTATATVTVPATPAAPPAIESLVWAAAVDPVTNAPAPSVDRLTADVATIYAVARVANLPAGASLTATWAYNGTPLDAATRSFSLSAAFQSGYVEFHLTRSGDRPWPEGTYAVTIAIDGVVTQSAEIEVVEP